MKFPPPLPRVTPHLSSPSIKFRTHSNIDTCRAGSLSPSILVRSSTPWS